MGNVRWPVVVTEEADRALRSWLGATGARKGGLSRFVGEAVRARLFELTVEDAKERNGMYPQSGILAAIEEALADGQGAARPAGADAPSASEQ